MRNPHNAVLSALGLGLLASLNVLAATPYYNPSNPASSTGKTTGYELYKTIGCPGRGLLEDPCAGSIEAKAVVLIAAPVAKAAPIDSDGDGVPDAIDQCPDTPAGARVDARGCELDSDHDGVVDRLDQCPDTPAGATVDARGCELDSDHDGVVDRLDQCPDTPAGATVDARGCELDSDHDGVVDRLDQCPDTVAGAKVDARGCELDSDGDGVVDRLDLCLDTPVGVRVDASGCPLPKTLKLEGVRFDNDSDVLRHESDAILDEATATLKRYPEFKVEVAGYTDSRGSSEHNLDLSSRRAKAVMDYFIAHGISADRLSAKGYGDANPIANNYLEEGRMKNRRVDLRPLN